jgi:hypothetical protein
LYLCRCQQQQHQCYIGVVLECLKLMPDIKLLASVGDFALKHAAWMVAGQYKPAELAKSEWEAVQQGPPWAVDSWGLGCMMQVGDWMRILLVGYKATHWLCMV